MEGKDKKVFDKDAGIKILLKFLCPQVMDEYNYGMNNVDQADHLRGSYRFNCWMQKSKWWCSPWMWGVQVLLVNAYVLYKSAHLLVWKTPKKDILSQHDFQKSIVLDWFGCHQENGCSDSEKNSSENSRKRTRCDFSASLEEEGSSKRAARVMEQTLDPIDGAL
jgi:hypothetical protein